MRSDSTYGSECEAFTAGDVRHVRELVAGAGRRAGFGPVATRDLVAAVNDIVVDAAVHAGGHGSITITQSPDGIRVEVSGSGRGGVTVRMFVPVGAARAWRYGQDRHPGPR